jgi:hypothetical protein
VIYMYSASNFDTSIINNNNKKLPQRIKLDFEHSNILLRAVSHLTVLFRIASDLTAKEEEDLNVRLEDWKKYAKLKVLK